MLCIVYPLSAWVAIVMEKGQVQAKGKGGMGEPGSMQSGGKVVVKGKGTRGRGGWSVH